MVNNRVVISREYIVCMYLEREKCFWKKVPVFDFERESRINIVVLYPHLSRPNYMHSVEYALSMYSNKSVLDYYQGFISCYLSILRFFYKLPGKPRKTPFDFTRCLYVC